jgi:hypothetical protein
MKTPREIFLAKHQAANAKLDKIRLATVTGLSAKAQSGEGAMGSEGESSVPLGSITSWRLFVENLWRELVLPKPRAWAAVATLWILILALKFSTHDGTPVVAKKSTLSPQVVAELKQQKAFFGELAGLPQLPGANPPKAVPPRPRSARNPEFSGA